MKTIEHRTIYPTFDQAKLLGLVPDIIPKTKSGSNRVKRWRCKQCENCHKSDCGKCENCLDKTKFGGMNRKRQSCVARTCLSMREVTDPLVPHKKQVTNNYLKEMPKMINNSHDEQVKTEPEYEIEEISVKGSLTLPYEDLVSKLKSLFDNPDDQAYWMEFCEASNVKSSKIDVKKEKQEIFNCQNCDKTYTKKGSLHHHNWVKHSKNKK